MQTKEWAATQKPEPEPWPRFLEEQKCRCSHKNKSLLASQTAASLSLVTAQVFQVHQHSSSEMGWSLTFQHLQVCCLHINLKPHPGPVPPHRLTCGTDQVTSMDSNPPVSRDQISTDYRIIAGHWCCQSTESLSADYIAPGRGTSFSKWVKAFSSGSGQTQLAEGCCWPQPQWSFLLRPLAGLSLLATTGISFPCLVAVCHCGLGMLDLICLCKRLLPASCSKNLQRKWDKEKVLVLE